MMTTSTMTAPARPQASTDEEVAIPTKQKETLNYSEHGRKLARLREHSKSKNSLKRIRGRGSSALHCVHSSSSLLMDPPDCSETPHHYKEGSFGTSSWSLICRL